MLRAFINSSNVGRQSMEATVRGRRLARGLSSRLQGRASRRSEATLHYKFVELHKEINVQPRWEQQDEDTLEHMRSQRKRRRILRLGLRAENQQQEGRSCG